MYKMKANTRNPATGVPEENGQGNLLNASHVACGSVEPEPGGILNVSTPNSGKGPGRLWQKTQVAGKEERARRKRRERRGEKPHPTRQGKGPRNGRLKHLGAGQDKQVAARTVNRVKGEHELNRLAIKFVMIPLQPGGKKKKRRGRRRTDACSGIRRQR